MIKNNPNPEETEYVIVPRRELNKISETLSMILKQVSNPTPVNLSLHSEYVEEKQARLIINRKTTWFWEMRTSGKLKFSKVGGKNYYKLSDLKQLLDQNYDETT